MESRNDCSPDVDTHCGRDIRLPDYNYAAALAEAVLTATAQDTIIVDTESLFQVVTNTARLLRPDMNVRVRISA